MLLHPILLLTIIFFMFVTFKIIYVTFTTTKINSNMSKFHEEV